MSKTSSETLIQEIGSDLVTFLKHGDLSSFSKQIDEELNIDEMERLLRIHFVLKEEVLDFVDALPERIRRIKTATKKNITTVHGDIRGRIDWHRTFKTRYMASFQDTSLFVITQMERDYGIPENLVLEKLIGTIHDIIMNDLKPAIDNEYPWVCEWFDKDHKKNLKDVYLKNVYIRRIRDDPHSIVTDRMIENTLRSRNPLYQDAALLLQHYQKLMNYDIDRNEAMDLLQSTFIKPDRIDVLFELYWTIQVINALQVDKKLITFHLIEGGNNIVAEWEDDIYLYHIYHNSTGTCSFLEHFSDIHIPEEDGYLKREGYVLRDWRKLCFDMFSKDMSDSLWGGRPDILVEINDKKSGKLCQVFIGEVKYTDSIDYAAQGLRELFEYIYLIKKDGRYFEDNPDQLILSGKIKGWLFLDQIRSGLPSMENISIITFNDENIPYKIARCIS